MQEQSGTNRYNKAKKRVAELKKFYTSLTTYLIFMVFLAGVNYYTNQFEDMWFLWAAFGWGIGIFFQALKIFNFDPIFGKDWEERKVQQFMDRERNNEDPLKF